MNPDQQTLLDWILAGLRIPEVREGRGDAAYLLGNMIAKYSLFADQYRLSERASLEMERLGVDLSKTYKRGHFYGKKSPFIYEHPIPANATLDHLLSLPPDALNHSTLERVLEFTSPAYILLREEDRSLAAARLGNRMPEGWTWDGSPLARYERVGIAMSKQFVHVEGKVKR